MLRTIVTTTLTLAFGLLLLLPGRAAAEPLQSLTTSLVAPQFSFDLPTERQSDDEEELSIDERRKIQARLKLRRRFVDVHQVLSFVTAGSIIAADILGTANKIALDSGSPMRSQLEGPLIGHRVLVATAISSYLGAGITAWTMPPALKLNRGKFDPNTLDSGKLHVAFSVIHGIAMAVVVATGILQANVVPAGAGWDALVTTHSIAGITAAGFVVAAGITIGTL